MQQFISRTSLEIHLVTFGIWLTLTLPYKLHEQVSGMWRDEEKGAIASFQKKLQKHAHNKIIQCFTHISLVPPPSRYFSLAMGLMLNCVNLANAHIRRPHLTCLELQLHHSNPSL